MARRNARTPRGARRSAVASALIPLSAAIPASRKSTSGIATSMNSPYAAASRRSTSASEATVRSTERWKRTIRPSPNSATAKGSISRYRSPDSASRSSAGIGVMLMMLCATECVSNR